MSPSHKTLRVTLPHRTREHFSRTWINELFPSLPHLPSCTSPSSLITHTYIRLHHELRLTKYNFLCLEQTISLEILCDFLDSASFRLLCFVLFCSVSFCCVSASCLVLCFAFQNDGHYVWTMYDRWNKYYIIHLLAAWSATFPARIRMSRGAISSMCFYHCWWKHPQHH